MIAGLVSGTRWEVDTTGSITSVRFFDAGTLYLFGSIEEAFLSAGLGAAVYR